MGKKRQSKGGGRGKRGETECKVPLYLRLDNAVHEKQSGAAGAVGVSLNELMQQMLWASVENLHQDAKGGWWCGLEAVYAADDEMRIQEFLEEGGHGPRPDVKPGRPGNV